MSDSPPGWERCSLCHRLVPPDLITLHHLRPKERGGKAHHRTPLCKPCHKQLHAMFSNKQLDLELNSLESLRSRPEIAAFVAWVRKQKPDRDFRTMTANSHPRKKRRRY